MKRVLALIMLSAVLLTQTEVYQLFKLTALANHFSDHAQRNPEISVGEFLTEHYLQGWHNDNDGASDQELPFKKSIAGLTTTPVTAAPFRSEFRFFLPPGDSFAPVRVSAGKTSGSESDIWQPPRCL